VQGVPSSPVDTIMIGEIEPFAMSTHNTRRAKVSSVVVSGLGLPGRCASAGARYRALMGGTNHKGSRGSSVPG
jgi:hypothetical protein